MAVTFPRGKPRRPPALEPNGSRTPLAAALITLLPVLPDHPAPRRGGLNDGNLFLTWRPWAVVMFCALAFVGRYAMLAWAARPKARRRSPPPPPRRRRPLRAVLATYIAAIGSAFLFVFPFAALWLLGSGGALKWIDSYGIQILIYVMLGWGLNIVVGLAGLLDLGYVAFYAVGAYSYALLATTFGLSFWICLPHRRHSRRAVGHDPRLSRAAPARRLSRHRDARLRRDHPHSS